MSRKPLRASAGGPSFFYLMLAQTCFQRAVGTRHPAGSGTLREIGRNYLANADDVASMLENGSQLLDCDAAGAAGAIRDPAAKWFHD
jgi:hypothetical protein